MIYPLSRVSLAFSFFFVGFVLFMYHINTTTHPSIHLDGVSQSFLSLSFPFIALYAVAESCGWVACLLCLEDSRQGIQVGSGRVWSEEYAFLFYFFIFGFPGFWAGLDWTGRDWRGKGGLTRFGLCVCVRATVCWVVLGLCAGRRTTKRGGFSCERRGGYQVRGGRRCRVVRYG